MSRHSRGFYFFLAIVLAVLVLMQVSIFRRLRSFSDRIDQLAAKAMSHTRNDVNSSNNKKHSDKEYPGDDGDWLIWGLKVEPKTLNPISVDRDIYQKWIAVPNIFEPLLQYDFETAKLEPWLAESYEITEGGKEVTFKLRDDICFSDGVEISADDVIFTFETIVNPKIDASNIANNYYDVEKAEKIDIKTVRFTLKQFNFKSLENLAFWDVGILPKHIYEFSDPMEFNTRVSDPVGSGPYMFESWSVGKEIVLKRNENYWGKRPRIQKRVYRFITNDLAALQALKSGQIDILRPSADQFYELEKDEKFNKEFLRLAYWNPAVPFYFIGWNQDHFCFADKKVRLALTHLVDRQKMVDAFLKGNAEVVTGPLYFKGPHYNKDVEPWPYDIQKAKELLNQAGWSDTDGDGWLDKNGQVFRFKFSYAASSTLYVRVSKFLKDEFAKVGIDMVADPMEWTILIGNVNERKFDSVIMGWGGDILQDPYQLWHSSQIESGGSNYVGFRSERADMIIEQARSMLNDDARNQLYHELHQILHDEQPYTFLYTVPTFRLVHRRFQNVNIHPLGLNYFEWYVPAEKQRYE